MQQTVYKCDHCKKEIGKIHHVSLMVNLGVSGIAIPPKAPSNTWMMRRLPSGFLHFCNPEHLSAFFKAELAGAKDKSKNSKS